jgi:hypothetical protein
MSGPAKNDGSAPISRELQQLWLQIVRSPWSSLVVIPTEPGTSGRMVTSALAGMTDFYDLGHLRIVQAQGASLQDGVRIAKELTSAGPMGERVVAAVDYPMENGGAMPVIMAAEAAILIVRLGSSSIDSTRTIINIAGRERVLGTIALSRRYVSRDLSA